MKLSLLLLGLGLTITTQASWFGSSSEPEPYTTWSSGELTSWLQARNIPIPEKTPAQADLRDLVKKNWDSASAWTYDQYVSAQKAFTGIRDASFDTWDESHLREFLLKQGIIAPKGPREQLVQLVKSQYRAYTNAASSFSSRASTVIYGDPTHQVTQSLSSLVAHVTNRASRVLDDSKDYVYSNWDDNQLRNYLESKGVQVKEQTRKSRSDLLGMMHDAYAKVTKPVWEAWSDSYLHEWLVSHNIIAPTTPSPYSRDYLLKKMADYYYDANETVYSTWSNSQLKEWLVQQGIVKSDAQIKREKLLKLVEDNYLSAKSSLLDAWSDSQIRDYLIEHGYLDSRSAFQMTRDELVNRMKDKYSAATSASYLTWPDARLRAYLRQHNLSEAELPTSRPGLLQETRIRWVQTQTMWAKVREIVGSMEESAEDKLNRLWSVLRGESEVYDQVKRAAGEKYEQVKEKYEQGKWTAREKYDKGKEGVSDMYDEVKQDAGDVYEQGKRQSGETYKQGKRTAEDKSTQAEQQFERKYSDAEKAYEAGKERAYEKAHEAKEKAGETFKTTGQKLKEEL